MSNDQQPKRTAVRAARVAAGFALLPVGVALLVLPGPGIPVVVGSLMLLEGEFHWAGTARRRIHGLAERGVAWVQAQRSKVTDR
ncbi:MAG TPA: PGPGW domain-containing protein [Polyangiales bacterium]|nr:PGPGW domain-containing protein [Polyangiales bacterium]